MDSPILYLLFALCIGSLFPIYCVMEGRGAKEYINGSSGKLVSVYRQTILIQIGLVFLMLLTFHFNQDSIDVIGLSFLKNPFKVVSLIAICFLFIAAVSSKKYSIEEINQLKPKYAEVLFLLPKNVKEYRWSIALSFVAGTCEEILYRGYLFWYLTFYMHMVIALIVTNVIFGILHFGTGFKNAVSTFVFGLLYSALSVPFDTLWFAILAHILTDLYSIGVGYKINKPVV